MCNLVERQQIARAKRREEANAALELEVEREAAITTRLEQAVRDLEAWRVDEAALARMAPDDVALIRELGFTSEAPSAEAVDRLEARVTELEEDLADTRRRQQAYRRFIEAIDGAEPS
jgi:hypothetical protein